MIISLATISCCVMSKPCNPRSCIIHQYLSLDGCGVDAARYEAPTANYRMPANYSPAAMRLWRHLGADSAAAAEEQDEICVIFVAKCSGVL